MKKILCAMLGMTMLSACASIETDMEKSQAERAARRAEHRAAYGCGVLDDHGSYRQCVLKTYYANRPHTYTTARMSNGQPIAIVGNARKGSVVEQVYRVERIVPETVVVTEQAPVVYVESVPVQEPVPVREKTWWETYQAERKPVSVVPVKCPCADPNVPCPQCTPK